MANRAHGLIDGIEDRDRAFFGALQGEDDLGMVIRAHIHIEHELQQFILAVAPRPALVKFTDIDFEAATRLALILGLNQEFQSALKAVGTLRNNFSHKLEMQLGNQEANNLYSALGQTTKELMQKSYATLARKQNEKPQPRLNDLSPRDRVTLAFISIRGSLVAERLIAERKM